MTKRNGFKRRSKRDMERRDAAKRAVLEDKVVVANRAMKRAHGERGYKFGLGRMDVPK